MRRFGVRVALRLREKEATQLLACRNAKGQRSVSNILREALDLYHRTVMDEMQKTALFRDQLVEKKVKDQRRKLDREELKVAIKGRLIRVCDLHGPVKKTAKKGKVKT